MNGPKIIIIKYRNEIYIYTIKIEYNNEEVKKQIQIKIIIRMKRK